jgi:hypothetical protein
MMAIGYKDFLPAVLKSGFFSTEHEVLPAAVVRANEWIATSGVTVINVETVVLPNVREVDDASRVGLRTSGEMSSHWFQVVRVWYEMETPPA